MVHFFLLLFIFVFKPDCSKTAENNDKLLIKKAGNRQPTRALLTKTAISESSSNTTKPKDFSDLVHARVKLNGESIAVDRHGKEYNIRFGSHEDTHTPRE